MEESNDSQIETNMKLIAAMKNQIFMYVLSGWIILILSTSATAQVRSGVGYLKLLPGARETGTAGTITGALDHTYSLFANPGAIGFLREWQWSASYTNWISDIYYASVLYGKRTRMPWSQYTRLVLGANYLGIPEFDSSIKLTPAVTGHDLLLTAGLGQPLEVLSQALSFGLTLKYYHSELYQYQADSWIFDFGLLYRTRPFKLFNPIQRFVDYGIFSAGLAITNLGKSVLYVVEGTPLPRTLRGGIALNLGNHNGFQFRVAADYRDVRDENGFVTLGAELSWQQIISLRTGYSFENNALEHFTFGGGFQIDDRILAVLAPGKNNALRVDLAINQQNDFFSSPYHGSITHLPIGPETFTLLQPTFGTTISVDSVQLTWEMTRDPDLFDLIQYWLIVDSDSLRMVEIIQKAEQDQKNFFNLKELQKLLVLQQLNQNVFFLNDLPDGDYYWTVCAYDLDQHIRFGKFKSHQINQFRVISTHPEIDDVQFEYYPWITDDDFQGTIKVDVANRTSRHARNLTVSLYDSLVSSETGRQKSLLMQKKIVLIEAGKSETIEFKWETSRSGRFMIQAELEKYFPRLQKTQVISRFQTKFYTIPKGTIASSDTNLVCKVLNITYELPYVGVIYFDSSSTVVKPNFIQSWLIEPPLVTLANRLRTHPQLKISLQGFADPNSGETEVRLADARAFAVRDSLIRLGAAADQIDLQSGTILSRRNLPPDPLDAQRILQERRRVDITAAEADEEILFGPVQTKYNEELKQPTLFVTNIHSSLPFIRGQIILKTDIYNDSLAICDSLQESQLQGQFKWSFAPGTDSFWHNQNADFWIMLTDSLNRTFKTPPARTFLESQTITRERMYFGIARFALAEPYYSFYWQNLLEKIPVALSDEMTRIKFLGYACAIGPEPVNLKLSEKRAELFRQKFLTNIKKNYPEQYSEIKNRIDPLEAYGETRPFFFRSTQGDTLILGDNQTPLGRQLNRRVMVIFYSIH